MKIGMVSLGCAKNLIDSEMILGMFQPGLFQIVQKPAEADVIIINTCGFIESARKESVDTIFEMAQYGAKLVVVGCLAQRYLDELKESLPEADLIVPIRDYKQLHNYLLQMLRMKEGIDAINPLKRVVSTPDYSAYLRISEGCDNFCAFCAIPLIRGRFHSRPFQEVMEEAEQLKEKGVKEITLISQDTTKYGADFKGSRPNIVDLLREVEALGFYSIRLLYLYPDEVTEELLQYIKGSKAVAHYFDLPIQSGSTHVLHLMGRKGGTDDIRRLVHRIKELMPDAITRSTFICGFPGESKKDHEETLSIIKELEFDHAGAFTYSREEGTRASFMKGQCHQSTKDKRLKELMTLQREVSLKRNLTHIGEVMEGIVTGYDSRSKRYTVRTYWNAPDDVDGNIYVSTSKCLKAGQIVSIKVTAAFYYDLSGELVG